MASDFRLCTVNVSHSAVKEDPLNHFFPQTIQPQLCTLSMEAYYIPLGAPATRKGERYLLLEWQLQGYFFSLWVSGWIHTLEKKTWLKGKGE